MASLLLRLTVLAIIVGVALSSTDVERERRGFKFSRFFKKIGKGIEKAADKVGNGIKDAAVAVGKGTKKAAVTVGKGIEDAAVEVGKGTKKAAVTVAKGTKKAAVTVAKGTKKAAVTVAKGTKKAAVAVGKGIKKAANAVGKGVKRLIQKIRIASIKWMFPYITYQVADNEDEEAEIILTKTESTINKGNGLINEGKRLMAKASTMEKSLGNNVNKRGLDDSIANGFKSAIKAIRSVAKRAINVGRKVISNSDKIKAAFGDAVTDISVVVSNGVSDIAPAIRDISRSISVATTKIQGAKTYADKINDGVDDGIVDTVTELANAGKLAIEAGKEYEEVGRRSLSLAQRLFKLGKDLVKVFARAAKNIWKATGLK
ncbi:serine/threonine protein kinase [Elysia marginata]|uniref:Serine/threonine protein kinase n=1 Tax=Elysia marginata TaxID=1093978 RepID=A0AAV4FL29_9GAST|nr:serine/threonine protein kinase [Elysia marginata]